MKRILSIILALVLLVSFTSCNGNFVNMDLNEPIALTEDGVVEKSVFENIKNNNAIATFTGVSNDIKYEWTIFSKDIKEAKDTNLFITLEKTDKGIKVVFSESDDFGFSALLSIHLDEMWSVDSATAYNDGQPVYSVSITGSKTSILNVSIDQYVSQFEIIPNIETLNSEETTTNQNNSVSEEDTTDSKNSSTKNDDKTTKPDETTSNNSESIKRPVSDGKDTGKDKYETDPIPEGKPKPVEPENQDINKKKEYTCIFSIECSTILNNLSNLDPDKLELIPSNGVILPRTEVTFYEGESVFDVLQRVCEDNDIHLESSWTPVYNSAYIEGINNIYEFDCGELSGWMYRVNGWYPNYGCSRYQLADGDVVEWRYTCDLGNDIGSAGMW